MQINFCFQPRWSNGDQIYPPTWNSEENSQNTWNNDIHDARSQVTKDCDPSDTINKSDPYGCPSRERGLGGAGGAPWAAWDEEAELRVWQLEGSGQSTREEWAAQRENQEISRGSPWVPNSILTSTYVERNYPRLGKEPGIVPGAHLRWK